VTELFALPATQIAQRVAAKTLSARDVTEAALARLDAVNPALNAVVVPLHEEARAAANHGFDQEPHKHDALSHPVFAVQKLQPPAAAAGWLKLSRRNFLQD
jgi:Asp-tRNA(Asn)/Glu-tRNA(Gln) amidotransferase A subunit family amidase